MLYHVVVINSFLELNNIPLYGYTIICLSIRLLMDIWTVSTFWVLWRVRQWRCMYIRLFEYPFLILLHAYLGVELLDHMIILCITFWGTCKLFSTVLSHFALPPAMYKCFNFSTSLPTLAIYFHLCIYFWLLRS